MSAVTQAGSGPTRDELERSLADRLGISPNATPEEIAAAHDAVATFLADAPRDLRGWAAARAAEADEAGPSGTPPASTIATIPPGRCSRRMSTSAVCPAANPCAIRSAPTSSTTKRKRLASSEDSPTDAASRSIASPAAGIASGSRALIRRISWVRPSTIARVSLAADESKENLTSASVHT